MATDFNLKPRLEKLASNLWWSWNVELDNLTGVGTGVMLFVNIPIMLLFGGQAMRAYHNYVARLKAGQMGPDHPKPSIEDVVSGRNLAVRKD